MANSNVLTLLICCAIGAIPASGQHDYDAEAWAKASEYLRQAMDTTVRPCEQFYKHVCGNYGTKNDSSYETNFEGKLSAMVKTLQEAIRAIEVNKESTPRYHKAIRVYYDQCIAVGAESNWQSQLYQAVVQRIGPVPLFDGLVSELVFNHWEFLATFQRQFGESIAVEASVVDRKQPCASKTALKLSTEVVQKNKLNMTILRDVMTEIATKLNKADTHTAERIDLLLANVTSLLDELAASDFANSNLEEVPVNNASSAPNFDGEAYLKGLFPDSGTQRFTQTTMFANLANLEKIGLLLKKYDSNTMRTLAFLVLVNTVREDYFNEIEFDFEKGELFNSPKTAEERCLEFTLQYLSPAVAHLYFDHINVDITKWRSEIQVLARNVIAAFRFLLNSVDWLDAEDKEKIQEKVDRITVNPGLPSWINNQTEIMARIVEYDINKSPIENDFDAEARILQRSLQRLVLDKVKDMDPNPKFTVNAFYDDAREEINLYLGLMLPPMFNHSYPLPVKYGGVGFAVAHELIHSFDSLMEKKTGESKPTNALKVKPLALKKFNQQANCLIKQYSKHCYSDIGKCVRGELTISENLADIEGLKVAYTAYKVVAQVIDEDPPLPDMLEYTNDQLFFITAARIWCSKGTPSHEIFSDEHSPDRERIEVIMQNMPLFAHSFRCISGSKYAPSKRCSIWGELFQPC